MEYIITNGTYYMKKDLQGRYNPTSSIILADKFSNAQAAINVLQNSISKCLRNTYYVAKNEISNSIKPVNKERKKQANHKTIVHDTSIKYWLDKIQSLNGLCDEAQARQTELCDLIKKYDLAIQDILHYLEFQTLNACELCKVAKQLQEFRRQRREFKNENQVVHYIVENKILTDDLNKLIQTLNESTYTPRVLDELFL